jgi:hypothetical protein
MVIAVVRQQRVEGLSVGVEGNQFDPEHTPG